MFFFGLEFYGDDGLSSLSSFNDDKKLEDSTPEGRQALIALVEKSCTRNEFSCQELWYIKYDQIVFNLVYVSKDDDVFTVESNIDDFPLSNISFCTFNEEDEKEEEEKSDSNYASVRRKCFLPVISLSVNILKFLTFERP